jgi:arylsulfatase A-like enzyme
MCEVAIALFKIFVLDRFVWLSRDLMWMAPLSALLFTLVPGIPLALMAALWPKIKLSWVLGILSAWVAFSLLLGVPRIAHYATAIVAIAIAVQFATSARRTPNRWRILSRRGTLFLALFVIISGVGERVWRMTASRLAPGGDGEVAGSAPNVLLIIFDTVRHANLSLYGYNRPTSPRLSELATESKVFDFALTTAPWTLPSHATLFTGRYPDSLTGDWRHPIADDQRTLAHVLSERGYATAGFVNNLLYTSYESELDQGYRRYVDYPVTFPVIVRHFTPGRTGFVTALLGSRSLYALSRAIKGFNLDLAREGADEPANARRLSDAFLQWERERGERPFFAFINYFEAHGLFQPTPQEEQLFPGGKRIDYYDAAIHRLDAEVGRIVDSLRQRGVLDNTLLIVTSDHGEHFGESGLQGHANSLYLPLLRVPLVMRFPARLSAQRINEPVTLRDLPATILDFTAPSEGSQNLEFPGVSMARLWATPPDTNGSPLFASLSQGINVAASSRNANGSLATLFGRQYQLIRGPGDHEELYDYRSDSLEQHDLIRTHGQEPEVRALREALLRLTGEQSPAAAAQNH